MSHADITVRPAKVQLPIYGWLQLQPSFNFQDSFLCLLVKVTSFTSPLANNEVKKKKKRKKNPTSF